MECGSLLPLSRACGPGSGTEGHGSSLRILWTSRGAASSGAPFVRPGCPDATPTSRLSRVRRWRIVRQRLSNRAAPMNALPTRRQFLKATVAGSACLGADIGFLSRLRPVSAAEAALETEMVRFRPEIEPLVRLLEDTPRERLLEEVAWRIKHGLGYRELLAAMLLAGVRNIQPRPVGFKFHAVLVVNSAHLASLASTDSDRWLPIFWALDHFKSAQAQDVKEGDWTMRAADAS